MKIKILLLLVLGLYLQSFDRLNAQTLAFSGPTTVNSGTVVTFTVLNETLSKFIGSVPLSAWIDSSDPAALGKVSCILYTTHYFDPSKPNIKGKFEYTLKNTGSMPYLVKLTFANLTIVYGTVPTTGPGELTYEITVNPAPPVVTFLSEPMSGSFVKNDCDNAGGSGSAVIYSMPRGQYTSIVSQAEADQLAASNFNTLGQAYANTYGSCQSAFSLVFSSTSTPVNDAYPVGAALVTTFSFLNGQTPSGVRYELKLSAPDGTTVTYGPQTTNRIRITLSQEGQYIVEARTISSEGIESAWLQHFLMASN